MGHRTVPLRRAVLLIALSVILVVAVLIGGLFYYQTIQSRRLTDPGYHLFSIVQTGPEKEALPTAFLAELLQLSVDQPVNLYAFDCATARRRLLAMPIIQTAQVKTFIPGTVYIDYTTRKPVAYLRDYSNTAIDAEGVLIPCDPFFTPKKIPTIYLGLPALERVWGTQVKDAKLDLAFALCNLTDAHLIDVSQAKSSSLGQRQIVLKLEERFEYDEQGVTKLFLQPVLLRLNPLCYQEALADYQLLRNHLRAQTHKRASAYSESLVTLPELTVDMRVAQLAYLREATDA